MSEGEEWWAVDRRDHPKEVVKWSGQQAVRVRGRGGSVRSQWVLTISPSYRKVASKFWRQSLLRVDCRVAVVKRESGRH